MKKVEEGSRKKVLNSEHKLGIGMYYRSQKGKIK